MSANRNFLRLQKVLSSDIGITSSITFGRFIFGSTVKSFYDLRLGLKKSVHKFNWIKFLKVFNFFANPYIV